MVGHEAVAMGAIGDQSIRSVLQEFCYDENQSFNPALDLLDWCKTKEWEENNLKK